MKESEKKILKCLRSNARESLVNISRDTDIPTSTVFLKVKEQEKSIIKKHTSLLDYKRLGFYQWQKTLIKVAPNNKQEFKTKMLMNENVNSIYIINNEFDYLVETIHEDLSQYLDFMEKIRREFNVIEEKNFQVVEDLKRESFMTKDAGRKTENPESLQENTEKTY